MNNKKTIALATAFVLCGTTLSAQKTWTLRDCIDYAIAHNITIRDAENNTEQQKLQVNTAKWSRLPNVNASGNQNWSWGRTQTAIKDEDTGDYTTKYVDTSSNGTSMNLNASVPLFTGFELPNRYSLSQLNLKAAIADLDKAKEDISINIASQYLQVLFNLELRKVAQGQVALSKEQYQRIARLEELGKASPAEVADAKSRVSQDELSLVQSNNNFRLALLDLSQLIEWQTPEELVIEEPDTTFRLAVLTPPDETYQIALGNKAAIQAAQYRLQGSEHSIKIAQSALYPQLSLNGSLGTSYYSTINRTFNQQLKDNFSRYIGFSLSIPIFNRFQTRNNIRAARLQRDHYALQLENTQKTLFKEIQQAWYNATAAQSKYLSSIAANEASQASFVLMKEKFENGRATSIEYNEAKQHLMQAESNRLQAKYEYIFRSKILDFYKGIEIR